MLKSRFVILSWDSFIILGICLTLRLPEANSTTVRRETTTEGPEEPVLSSICGEVLTGTLGIIAYQPVLSYRPNERCMWTVRVPEAERIVFGVFMSGIHDVDDGIFISTFNKDSSGGLQVVNHEARYNNTGAISVTGSVATVVFYTDALLEGTGFMLTFQKENTNATEVFSPNSRDFIGSIEDGGLAYRVSHPSTRNYDNNEFSTFMFAPPDFTHRDNMTQVTFTKRGLDAECNDDLNSFVFTPKVGWVFVRQYCSSTDSVTDYYADVPLYIFTSDSENTSTGFSLDFKTSA